MVTIFLDISVLKGIEMHHYVFVHLSAKSCKAPVWENAVIFGEQSKSICSFFVISKVLMQRYGLTISPIMAHARTELRNVCCA